ncbi:MAG TPA: serine/threonine-protein kinase [Mycobacteriales bacterium]|nr:serine/threonine-protein kinase [Mycobacteriales bacterium]
MLTTGAVLGDRYALERRIAVGGMGEVWAAEDRLLGRPVAVKTARPEVQADAGFADRLLAEARHAAAVAHPGIAEVYDVSAAEPVPYLVMELVDGRPLSQVIADEAPLPPERARRIVCQVAAALDAAHAVGLVHRDVKPSNLLLTADDRVKVTDFGIARAVDAASVTRSGFVVGTAQYLSPEQTSGQPASAASDLYALGVVAFELLTGRRPFDGDPMQVLAAHRDTPAPELPESVPADLRELVTALLHKDPGSRPSAAHVVGRTPYPSDRTAVLRAPAVAGGSSGPATAPAAGTDDGTDAQTAPHAVLPTADPAAAPTAAPALAPHARPHAGPAAAWRRAAGEGLRTPRWLPALALAAAVGVIGVVALTAGGEGGPSGSSGAPQPVPVAAASLFHPGGSDGDYPGEVPRVVDGDPATVWHTQTYSSPEFGNLRPGVGVLFDLGEPRAVREVRLSLPTPGLDLRVHAGDEPGAGLLETEALGAVRGAPGSTVVRVEGAPRARYWVVWVERLPPSGRAEVAEASFLT